MAYPLADYVALAFVLEAVGLGSGDAARVLE